MSGTQFAACVGVSLVVSIAVLYAGTYFGLPGLSPRPPRNEQSAGQ